MNRFLLSGAFVLACAVAEAATVSITSCEQDAASGLVSVSYKLSDGPAIVTFGLKRPDGSALPGACAYATRGAINRKLASGTHAFTWLPGETCAATDLSAGAKVVLTAWAESNPPQFMAVDPALGEVSYYETKDQVPGGLTGIVNKSSRIVFRRIAAKDRTFAMGSDESDDGHLDNETVHQVTLTNDFWMGVIPVTQGQYKEISNGSNPSYAHAAANYCRYPNGAWRSVEQVTFAALRGSSGADWPNNGHAVASTSIIGVLRDRTGNDRFDLPTEAEWEFACRAGTTSALNNGKNWSYANVREIAWVNANSPTGDSAAALVGEKEPNAWDLYDMHGTVCEMCLDWYSDDLGGEAVTAPVGPTSGTDRVLRGGGMAAASEGGYKSVRSAARLPNASTGIKPSKLMIGFRLSAAIPVGTDDEPASDEASLTAVAQLMRAAAEPTGHGTPEQPFEAWDRDFGEAWIEKFSSFPPLGLLLMVR